MGSTRVTIMRAARSMRRVFVAAQGPRCIAAFTGRATARPVPIPAALSMTRFCSTGPASSMEAIATIQALNSELLDKFRQGDYVSSLDVAEQSIELSRELFEDVEGLHPGLASGLNNLGRIHKALGDFPAAGKAYQEAADIYILVYGESHRSTATALQNLVRLLLVQQQIDQAKSLADKVVTIRRQLQAEVDTAGSEYSSWTEDKRTEQAANDAQHTAGALNVMAEILLAESRAEPRKKHKQIALTNAQETLLEAEDVLETHGMGQSDSAAGVALNFTRLHQAQGDTKGAVEQAEKLVGIRLALNSGKHPLFASAVQNLAERYVDHRELDKAKALFEMLEEQFDVKTR